MRWWHLGLAGQPPSSRLVAEHPRRLEVVRRRLPAGPDPPNSVSPRWTPDRPGPPGAVRDPPGARGPSGPTSATEAGRDLEQHVVGRRLAGAHPDPVTGERADHDAGLL